MATLSTKLFYSAFTGFSLAVLIFLFLVIREKRILRDAGVICALLAFILLTAGMIARVCELKHPPLSNMFEYMTVMAWFASLGFLIIVKLVKNPLIAAFNGGVIFMCMAAASLLPKEGSSQLMPALRSVWLQIHVTLAAASEGAFALGFGASCAYLLKSFLSDSNGFSRRLPSLTALDSIAYRSIAVGYPLFTIGALFAGAIWAHQAWGRFWSWDPKETCSLVVWIIYSGYLHVRIVQGTKGRITHVLSIFGFAAALLTFFASMFLGGLHAYN